MSACDPDSSVEICSSAENPVVVTGASGSLGSQLVVVSASFTRPNDTTGYTAKDAISNGALLNFQNIVPEAGGSGYLTKARAMTNLSTWTARIRLHLFHTAPTPIADNAPYTLLYANRANRAGYIDFPGFVTEGTGSDAAYSSVQDLRLPFECASSGSTARWLFGIAEAVDAATPAGNQGFFFELTADVN